MTASDIVREKRQEILAIARKHGAFNVRVLAPSRAERRTSRATSICWSISMPAAACSTSAQW